MLSRFWNTAVFSVFSASLVALAPACASRATRSIALYEAGDYAGAARAADQGLADHPDDDALWQMRIRAALAQGDAAAVSRAYASYMATTDGEIDKELLRDLAIATLGQALASPSAKLKITAIQAVADFELHALADQVGERLGDDNDRVAATAASAVLRGFPQAPEVADQMMSSEDPEARRIAVEGIGKKVGRLALADLEKAASDRDPRVRAAAIRWLGQLKDTDAVELLVRRMRDPDDSVRAAAALALGRIGLGNLADHGKRALADRALAVRLAGIELLVAAHRDDELVKLTDDPHPLVALQAAIELRGARPELAAKALDRALAAESWTARAGAVNLIVRAVGKAAARPYAARLAADPELGVRLAAARVLAQSGDRATAIAVYAAALESDRGLQAAADLAELDDGRGSAALSAAVRDLRRSSDERAQAAVAHRAAHRVTPGLVAALADPSGVVRVEAAAALAALTK